MATGIDINEMFKSIFATLDDRPTEQLDKLDDEMREVEKRILVAIKEASWLKVRILKTAMEEFTNKGFTREEAFEICKKLI